MIKSAKMFSTKTHGKCLLAVAQYVPSQVPILGKSLLSQPTLGSRICIKWTPSA